MFTPEASYEAICRIGDLVAEDRYEEARPLLDAMTEIEDVVPFVLFYKAICIYEDKDDVECVRLLSRFIERAPRNEKVPYARLTIAVCLINLGAYAEAWRFLPRFPRTIPIGKERWRRRRDLWRCKGKPWSIARVCAVRAHDERDRQPALRKRHHRRHSPFHTLRGNGAMKRNETRNGAATNLLFPREIVKRTGNGSVQ